MKTYAVILVSVILFLGTALGLYLCHPSDSTNTNNVVDNTVRFSNEYLYELIRKDPRKLLKINDLVESSPFLMKHKIKFLERYYGRKSQDSSISNKKLLRLLVASQKKELLLKDDENVQSNRLGSK